MIYTSRYSNKELETGKYTCLRISIGAPRWQLHYRLDGAISELMPYKIFGIEDKEVFKQKYFQRLNAFGIDRIADQLSFYQSKGKDIVLLCYEDIRKGEENWCHRTMFAEWWLKTTGEIIKELPDPSAFKPIAPKNKLAAVKQEAKISEISLF